MEMETRDRRRRGLVHREISVEMPVNTQVEQQSEPVRVAPDEGMDMQQMVHDIFIDLDNFYEEEEAVQDEVFEPTSDEALPEADFDMGENAGDQRFLYGAPEEVHAAMGPLYAGSKLSKLAFVMMFMNICGNHNAPNVLVDELLTFLKNSVLPEGNVTPKNSYEAKKLTSKLGLNYESIHACPNGHVLFRRQWADCTVCPECGANRYRQFGRSTVPISVLRHFPLIPRLQRMFRCRDISKMMTWTSENKSEDGLWRHAGDTPRWKEIDEKYPEFAEEPRNVRVGISLDGMNPFGEKHNVYSCWPVTVLNYNLPPWMTTKRFFILLSLLIPGPNSALTRNIDVYLAPLVEELKVLWFEGVRTIDVLQREQLPNSFKLRGMLYLTAGDYPAHGMISGQACKGRLACTRCGPNVTSEYSAHLKCMKYLGHRRWLVPSHPYRSRASQILHFNNQRELRGPPQRVSSADIVAWGDLKTAYDRSGGREGGDNDPGKLYGLKRQSILDVELPYWRVSYPSTCTNTVWTKASIVCIVTMQLDMAVEPVLTTTGCGVTGV
jgi:hypothetical protein